MGFGTISPIKESRLDRFLRTESERMDRVAGTPEEDSPAEAAANRRFLLNLSIMQHQQMLLEEARTGHRVFQAELLKVGRQIKVSG